MMICAPRDQRQPLGILLLCIGCLSWTSISADSPLQTPPKKSVAAQQPELPELTAQKKQQIQTWVFELQRQRVTNRSRAERQLLRVGPAAVPYVVPVSRSRFDLARIAALRILLKSPRYEAASSALVGLEADNRWVRKLSWQLIEKISGVRSKFPWDGRDLARQRKSKARIWQRWYRDQENLCRQEERLLREADADGVDSEESAGPDPEAGR